jgi:Flp pilus assembly protein TadG
MLAAMTRRGRWSHEDGAELIEFALVLPMMLLVMFGIIDFGLLFQRYLVVTNAAREGARVAVLPGYTDADVQARVAQYLTAAGLTEAAPPPTIEQSVACAGGQSISVERVTVQYPYSYSVVGTLVGYFGGTQFTSTGLRAVAAMRSEFAAGGGC